MNTAEMLQRVEDGEELEFVVPASKPQLVANLMLRKFVPHPVVILPGAMGHRYRQRALRARRENTPLYRVGIVEAPSQYWISGDPALEEQVQTVSAELFETIDEALEFLTASGYTLPNLEPWQDWLSRQRGEQET